MASVAIPNLLVTAITLGIPRLDEQHELLIGLVEELRWEAEGQPALAVFQDWLERYLATSRDHFHDEEAYMASIGMPAIVVRKHARDHQRILASLAALAPRQPEDVTDIQHKIKIELFKHIAQFDLQIRAHLLATRKRHAAIPA
jgi:hemerythrin-like metal-binding protein